MAQLINENYEREIKELKAKILKEGKDVPSLSGFAKQVECLRISETQLACTCENCGVFYELYKNHKDI